MLEEQQVISLSRSADGFSLWLDNGESGASANAWCWRSASAGSSNMPDVLAALPPELASHSYDHHDLSRFAGKKLLVLGAGSSAVDTAVLAQRSRRRCRR